MKVLITGSNGQLGSELRDLSPNYKSNEFIFKDLPELDICDFEIPYWRDNLKDCILKLNKK